MPLGARCATLTASQTVPDRQKRGWSRERFTIITDSVKRFKWVGTRPIRPDGVDKVTGRALFGADMKMPGML